ncbi:phospholipase C [Sulfobacillus harzensis]|uniref:Phospholipase n=1 Tax=Sulfobacillus harzensis TaxID=2729629 RepID=A0A7Y0L785_9FIRM|nr:alkaline phosphatase family protein [Sulfobacillus harzensis]NMP23199.1 phospholipase [Sulfobacillus harzensis]
MPKRIVVYTVENHSFDQLLGTFPGVDGLNPNLAVPGPQGEKVHPFPFRWYSLGQFDNPDHSFQAIHEEWDQGKMDGFVRVGGRDTMGYYPLEGEPTWAKLIATGRILDHYFASVLGPTFPNRLYLIAGQSGGLTANPGLFSAAALDFPTLFDQLEEHHITWRYYIGGYRRHFRLLAKETLFCPLLWFPRFNHKPRVTHLSPWPQFFEDARNSELDEVIFLAPGLPQSSHPPVPITCALHSIARVHEALASRPDWDETLLIVNFDEAGGFYDHVPPPVMDTMGPGMRVPCLLWSGGLPSGVVHDIYDHTSVLRYIEENFGLPLLGERTTQMASLASALC